MHLKGNRVKLWIRNVRSVAKKASLQSSVEASECEDSKVDMVEQEEDCYIHSISGKEEQ